MRSLLARLLDPGGWDWGNVPDYIVALTALVSAILVVQQLTGLRDDRARADRTLRAQTEQIRSEARTARANLLLRIDEQYEGDAMLRSRARWVELRVGYRRDYRALTAPWLSRGDYVRHRMAGKLNERWGLVQSYNRGTGQSQRKCVTMY